MQVKQIENIDIPSYDQFIADNNGSFLQSVAWGKWQETNGRKAIRYTVTDETGTVHIAAQFLIYPLPLGQFYLYCPYGPVVNFQFSISTSPNVMQELVEQIKKDYPKALFIKLEPTTSFNLLPTTYDLHPSSRIQPGSTLLLDLAKTEEQLQLEMHQKTRYNIKVANRHGVLVKTGTNITGPEAQQILSLITKTTERQAYKGHPLSYYQNFCKFFADTQQRNDNIGEISELGSSLIQVRWFAAFYQENILSGGIFLDFGHTRTYLYGGSNDAQKNIMAPYALHWHAIRDAKQQGLVRYDFGGLETSSGTTPGFARFKLGFGGEPIQYQNPLDVYWNKIAYRGYTIAKRMLK